MNETSAGDDRTNDLIHEAARRRATTQRQDVVLADRLFHWSIAVGQLKSSAWLIGLLVAVLFVSLVSASAAVYTANQAGKHADDLANSLDGFSRRLGEQEALLRSINSHAVSTHEIVKGEMDRRFRRALKADADRGKKEE